MAKSHRPDPSHFFAPINVGRFVERIAASEERFEADGRLLELQDNICWRFWGLSRLSDAVVHFGRRTRADHDAMGHAARAVNIPLDDLGASIDDRSLPHRSNRLSSTAR
jgi:hypothetical protein